MPVSTQSSATSSMESGQEQIDLFKHLLTDGMTTGNASALLPSVMLDRQMNYMELTVGVDFLARISGSASQALNKLVSMT
ncbi:type III secretion system inner rod subunit SctI [Salmonella enterica]|nr:type III secretion system inner rod subunit SctI [Salmonella enterica]EIM8973124.1 type III secretion system inner rod subunit SctI [Salmonella enterica]EIS0968833.1 type III secretion system inner rod subunit SctI [Salmonella enterica]EIT1181529.1 type III secretion system inner rod subunit SctI [Salmonella enterica]EKJ5491475.1 type III secretion system inner rod subunit SctI [Salmonella enterica]